MPDATEYPYETHLDILCEPLETIDVQALADAVTHPWWNQTLTKVNDSVVRMGVVRGEYHWHRHDADDEFFYVVEGRLIIDVAEGGDAAKEGKGEGDGGPTQFRTVELSPRQGMVVPKGVVHRTRAEERTVILMVENAGIVPTGD